MPKEYQQLLNQVDELTAQLNERYKTHLQCRAGCSGCCHHHLSVFPVEAAAIKSAFKKLPGAIKIRIQLQAQETIAKESRGAAITCPLLVDDKCSVYEARPIICRTQGLPLLFAAEDGAQEVDFCPLNFTTDEALADLEDKHLVPLDVLNLHLAMVNIEYCKAQNIDPNERIKIADLCK